MVWLTLLALVCNVAWGEGYVTFSPATDVTDGSSITKSGITMSVSQGSLSGGDSYQITKGTNITFTTDGGSVGKIANVKMKFAGGGTSGAALKDSGSNYWDYDFQGNGVWSPRGLNKAEVTLNATSDCQITEVEVIFDGEAPVDPVAKPAAPTFTGDETFTDFQLVYLTADEGATIYWTSDGSTPSTESSVYNDYIYLTETTTIKAIAVLNGVSSDVAEKTFTKAAPTVTEYTIAQLHEQKTSMENVTLRLTDAKVVYNIYGDKYTAILREGDKAIDILNSSVYLPLNGTVSGTVTLNVNYNGGIITTSDIEGTTNTDNLEIGYPDYYEESPLVTTVANVKNYPGDYLKLENVSIYCDSYNDLGKGYGAYFVLSGNSYVYLSNGSDYKSIFDADANAKFDIVAWFNTPGSGMVSASLQITQLVNKSQKPAAPVISGDEPFTESTTVTITAAEGANIYYTVDGNEATTESTLYTEPFTITETTTVKAIAIVNGMSSDPAEKTFNKEVPAVTEYTIAQLHELKQNIDNVTLKLTDAVVAYREILFAADGWNVGSYNFVIREGDKAIDLYEIDKYVGLYEKDVTNGTIVINVRYEDGFLRGYNVDGETNASKLSVKPDYSSGRSTMDATVANLVQDGLYKGDLLKLKGVKIAKEENYQYFVTDGENRMSFVIDSYNAGQLISEDADQVYDIIALYLTPNTLNFVELTKGVAAPVISGNETFGTSATVTITAAEGANIYYTVDGSEPTTESTLYIEPFTITETATVKAIAELNGLTSNVAEKTFTKEAVTFTEYTIAQLHELQQDVDNVTLKLTDASVAYRNTNWAEDGWNVASYDLVIREGDKAIDLYGMDNSVNLYEEDLVNGTLKINVRYEDGFLRGYNIDGETIGNTLSVRAYAGKRAISGTLANIVQDGLFKGDVVEIAAVKIAQEENYRYFLTDGVNRKAFKIDSYNAGQLISEDADQVYRAVVLYDQQDTLTYIELAKVDLGQEATIAQLHDAQQGVDKARLTLNGAKVVYVENAEGNNVAILREEGKALDVFTSALNLPLGATVSGAVTLKVNYADGIYTATDIEGLTNASALTIVEAETPANDPVETAVADVKNYAGDLVVLKDMMILGNDDVYYAYTADYQMVQLNNPEFFAEALGDASQKYSITAWFNAPGTGYAAETASLKVVDLQVTQSVEYTDATIAELNAREDRQNNIRLVLNDAKVVYVRQNLYNSEINDIALRQDGKAVVLYGTSLPLTLNSTVSGSVKMNFYAEAGIPQLRDIDNVTSMNDLTVTESAETTYDPTEATFDDMNTHKADLVVLRGVTIAYGDAGTYFVKKDGQSFVVKNENENINVDALVSDGDLYDVTLWYNSYMNDAPELEFVEAAFVGTNGINGVDANYGEDGNTYNLGGVKVNKNYRGVVIRDGKKFVQK